MNFKKFQLKWKIVKHFARPKQRTALGKLFSLRKVETLPHLWKKNSLKKVYRNIQTFAFKVLQECSSWASRNGTVQILFLTPNWNMFAGKFLKLESLLAVLREHIISEIWDFEYLYFGPNFVFCGDCFRAF